MSIERIPYNDRVALPGMAMVHVELMDASGKDRYLSTDRGGRVLKGVQPNVFAESAVHLLSRKLAALPQGGS